MNYVYCIAGFMLSLNLLEGLGRLWCFFKPAKFGENGIVGQDVAMFENFIKNGMANR